MLNSLLYTEILIILLINFLFFINLKKISKKINIFDSPNPDIKIHKSSVFLGGGIVFYISFFLIYWQNIFFFDYYLMKISTFLLGTLIFILGLVDDKFKINYFSKFFFLIIILILIFFFDESVVVNNLKLSFTRSEFDISSYSYFFTLLCFLLFLNAANLFDGINFQCGAYFLIIFILFYFITKLYFFLLFAIPLIFFLFMNFKNKIFLGDSGSLFIAFLISYFSVTIYHQNFFDADDIIILMIVPGLDMFRLFIVRIAKKKNPFKGDLNHLHHLMEKKLGYNFSFSINIFFIVILIILKFIFDFSSVLLLTLYTLVYLILLFTLNKIKC